MSTKPFNISKSLIWAAYKKVKSNGGSAGVDKQSLQDFEANLGPNLYKIWNRMLKIDKESKFILILLTYFQFSYS